MRKTLVINVLVAITIFLLVVVYFYLFVTNQADSPIEIVPIIIGLLCCFYPGKMSSMLKQGTLGLLSLQENHTRIFGMSVLLIMFLYYLNFFLNRA